MIKAKVNGKAVNIPTSWEDVTFRQFIDLSFNSKDIYSRMGILLGIDPQIARKAKFQGLEGIIRVLAFLSQEAKLYEHPVKCGPYKFPQDITLESLEQFEVMNRLMKETAGKKPQDHIESLAIYAAIYCQGIDGDFDEEKAMKLAKDFDAYPCLEVMSAGDFFMRKTLSLMLNLPMNSLRRATLKKKSKRGSKRSMKRSASTGRLTQ